MSGTQPQNFEFHQYLKKILHSEGLDSSLFIATEKDFANSPVIDYPYRSYFYVVGLMHQGNDKIKVGFSDYELKDKTISFVGPGIVRQWENNDWNAVNHTVFFKADLFQKPFYSNFLVDYAYFKPGAYHALHLHDEDYDKAFDFLELMDRNRGDQGVLIGLLFSYLQFIDQLYTTAVQGMIRDSSHHKISNQFSQLLHDNYQKEKEVNFYVDQMNITPKYLSEILKKEVGKPAKQLIDDFILMEAESLLKQTHMSVKEILYWLGYEDPSYFSKLFKSKVGTTPAQYREK